jgi:hypothetical protein
MVFWISTDPEAGLVLARGYSSIAFDGFRVDLQALTKPLQTLWLCFFSLGQGVILPQVLTKFLRPKSG